MERRPNAVALAAQLAGGHMRTHFVSAAPDDSLLEADRIMRLARIRHLPIVNKGRLVGLLSHRDVLAASISKLTDGDPADRLNHLRGIKIDAVMSRDVTTGTEETTLGAAAQRMLRLKIGCLPIVRSGPEGPRLVGILTESDLLRAAYAPDFEGASD
ncbi:MAG TPA: CBS domain-containing protein [Myxococcota bacterium]|nr:CBS domain-containing protein [Myxococcota bacterium]